MAYQTLYARQINGLETVNGSSYPPPGSLTTPLPVNEITTGTGLSDPLLQGSGVTIQNPVPDTRYIDMNPTNPLTNVLVYDGPNQRFILRDSTTLNTLQIVKEGTAGSIELNNLNGDGIQLNCLSSGNKINLDVDGFDVVDIANQNSIYSSAQGLKLDCTGLSRITELTSNNKIEITDVGVELLDVSNNNSIISSSTGLSVTINGSSGGYGGKIIADGLGSCAWVGWPVGEIQYFENVWDASLGTDGYVLWQRPPGLDRYKLISLQAGAVQGAWTPGSTTVFRLTGNYSTGGVSGYQDFAQITSAQLITGNSANWGTGVITVVTGAGGDITRYISENLTIRFSGTPLITPTAGTTTFRMGILKLAAP